MDEYDCICPHGFLQKKISNFASKMKNFASWKGKFCKNFVIFLHSLISFSAIQILQPYTHKALSFSN